MKTISTLFCTLCAIAVSVPCFAEERRVPLNNPFSVGMPFSLKKQNKENTTVQGSVVAPINHRKKTIFYAPKQEQMIDVLSYYTDKTQNGETKYEMKYNDQGFLEEIIYNGVYCLNKYAYSGFVDGRWTKRVYTRAGSPEKNVVERKLDKAGRVVLEEVIDYSDSTKIHTATKHVREYAYDHNPQGVCVKELQYDWRNGDQQFTLLSERYWVWFDPMKDYLEFDHNNFSVSADGLSYSVHKRTDYGETYNEYYYNAQGEQVGTLYVSGDFYEGAFEITTVSGQRKHVVKNEPQSGWNTEWTSDARKIPGATDIKNCVEWNIEGKKEFTEGFYNRANVQIGKTEKYISYSGTASNWEKIAENEWTYVTDHIMKEKEWDNIEGTWEGYSYYENGKQIGQALLFNDGSYMVVTDDGKDYTTETKTYYTHYAADGTILVQYRSYTDAEVFPNSSLTAFYGIDRFQILKDGKWLDVTGDLLIGEKQSGIYISMIFDKQGRPLKSETYENGKVTYKEEYTYTDKTFEGKSFDLSSVGVLYLSERNFLEVRNNGAIFYENVEYNPNGASDYRVATLHDVAAHIVTNYNSWNEAEQRYMYEYKYPLSSRSVNERGEVVTIDYELQADVAVPTRMTESLKTPYSEMSAEYRWDAAGQKWVGMYKTNRGSSGVYLDFDCKFFEEPFSEAYRPTDYFSPADLVDEVYNLVQYTESWDYSYNWDETANKWVDGSKMHDKRSVTGNTLKWIYSNGNTEVERTYVRDEQHRLVQFDEKRSEYGVISSTKVIYTYDEKGRPKSQNQLVSQNDGSIFEVLREYFYTTIASDVEEQMAQQQWSIQGRTISSNTSLKVYDLSGRLVLQTQHGSAQLPASGVYVISCGGHTTKVVVK